MLIWALMNSYEFIWNVLLLVAQFFKQKSSWASQQVCWPSAEQADKFMFYFTKQVCRPSAEPADKLVGWLMKIFV
jgi:hypothetical protein